MSGIFILKEMICPKCKKSALMASKRDGKYICQKCREEFEVKKD